MKINKNLKIAIFSFLVLGLAAATAVNAHQGLDGNNINKRANSSEVNSSMNYEDRVDRMRAFHESMSEEDLDKMNEMHELMLSGEYEKALELRDEMNLGQGMRQGMMGSGNRAHGSKTRGAMPGFVDANSNGICDNMENIEIN